MHVCAQGRQATGPPAQAHAPPLVLSLRQVITATAQTKLSAGLHAPFRRQSLP